MLKNGTTVNATANPVVVAVVAVEAVEAVEAMTTAVVVEADEVAAEAGAKVVTTVLVVKFLTSVETWAKVSPPTVRFSRWSTNLP